MDFGGDQIPTLAKAMSSLIDVPINRYSADSITLMQLGVTLLREELAKHLSSLSRGWSGWYRRLDRFLTYI
jgi:hypothetical protein